MAQEARQATLLARINGVCDAFEDQWQAGARPQIEAFLEGWEEPERRELFHYLLELDAQYSSRGGVATSPEDYIARFPEYSALLSEAAKASVRMTVDNTDAEDQCGPPSPAGSSGRPILQGDFGRYRVLRMIGSGGMGAVYLAEDRELHRRVALKTPWLFDLHHGEATARFVREARAAAGLHHPYICPVYDIGEIDGVRFITMAYIEGRTLAECCQPERLLDQYAAGEMIRKLCLALAEAHRQGVTHRDIKPGNIMIDGKGDPVLMDFGLARLNAEAGDAQLTRTGAILGTVAYMAPEQVEGRPDQVGPAVDIYSLGVVMYQLLTGQIPHRGDMMAMMMKIVNETPSPPRELRPDLDERLQQVCLKMMAKNIQDRYGSMTEAASDLQEILDENGASRSDLLTPPSETPRSLAPRSAMPVPAAGDQAQLETGVNHDPTRLVAGTGGDWAEAATLPTGTTTNSRPAVSVPRPWRGAAVLFVSITAILLLGAGFASGIFKFAAGDGYLVIKVSDDDFETTARGRTITIQNTKTLEKYTIELDRAEQSQPLRPGEYQFDLSTSSGLRTRTNRFTIASGADRQVEVWWEPKPTAAAGPRVPGEKTEPALAGDSLPAVAPPKPAAAGTWLAGPTGAVLPGGVAPAPRLFDAIGRWQMQVVGGQPRYAEFSPDGELIAVQSGVVVEILEADTGTRRFLVSLPHGDVHSAKLAWSPDGRYLAVHPQSPQEFQFRIFSREGKQVFGSHDPDIVPGVGDLSWSPNSDRIMLRMNPPRPSHIIPVAGQPIRLDAPDMAACQWSKDGSRLLTLGSQSVAVWSDQAEKLHEFAVEAPKTASWQPARPCIVTTDKNGLLRTWTPEGQPLPLQVEGVADYAWSDDGELLAVAAGQEIRVFNQRLELRQTMPSETPFVVVGPWRPDKSGIFALRANKSVVYVPLGGEHALLVQFGAWSGSLAHWDKAGSHLLMREETATHLWTFDGQEAERTPIQFLNGYGSSCVAWRPDGASFLISKGNGGLQTYHADGRAIAALTSATPQVNRVVASPKNDRFLIYSVSAANVLQVFSLNGELLRTIELGVQGNAFRTYPVAVDWHVDGKHLACCYDGRVSVYDVDTGNEVIRSPEWGFDAVFRPGDPDTLAIAGFDHCFLWRWRIESRPQREFAIRRQKSGALTWTPSGDQLLLSDYYTSTQVFGIDGKLQLEIPPMKDSRGVPAGAGFDRLAFDPDGQFFLAPNGYALTLEGERRELTEADADMVLVRPSDVCLTPDQQWLIEGGDIYRWDAATRTKTLSRRIVLLPDQQVVVISPAGEILWESADARRHLAYVVEETDGRRTVLSDEEFRRRVGLSR